MALRRYAAGMVRHSRQSDLSVHRAVHRGLQGHGGPEGYEEPGRPGRTRGRGARLALVTLLVLATLSAAPAPAAAQEAQKITVLAAASVFAAADVFFIGYALALSERNRQPARGVVGAEVVVTTLQLASGLSLFFTGLQSDDRLASFGLSRDVLLPVGALLAVVAVPLLLHGVRAGSSRVGTGMHSLQLVPGRIGDQRASGPGLLLVGRF